MVAFSQTSSKTIPTFKSSPINYSELQTDLQSQTTFKTFNGLLIGKKTSMLKMGNGVTRKFCAHLPLNAPTAELIHGRVVKCWDSATSHALWSPPHRDIRSGWPPLRPNFATVDRCGEPEMPLDSLAFWVGIDMWFSGVGSCFLGDWKRFVWIEVFGVISRELQWVVDLMVTFLKSAFGTNSVIHKDYK